MLRSIGVDCFSTDHVHAHVASLPAKKLLEKEEGLELINKFTLPQDKPVFESKDLNEDEKKEKLKKLEDIFIAKEKKDDEEDVQDQEQIKKMLKEEVDIDIKRYNPLI